MSLLRKIKEKNRWFNPVKNFFIKTKSVFFELFFIIVLAVIGVLSWIFSNNLDIGFYVLAKTLSVVLVLTSLKLTLELFPENRFQEIAVLIIELIIGLIILVYEKLFLLVNVFIAVCLVFFVQFGVLIKLQSFLNSPYLNEKLVLFITSLSTLVLVSYFGRKLLLFILKILIYPNRHERWHSRILVKYRRLLRSIDFRKWAFLIATTFYLISVVEDILEISLFNFEYWVEVDDIILVAFLSFLAIDRFINNFNKNLLQSAA